MTAVVRQAIEADVASIARICATSYRDTYRELLPQGYIDRSVVAFYDEQRVAKEVAPAPPEWFGYQVVEERGRVLGAAGGGMIGKRAGELSLVHLEAAERGRGLGTALLDRVTTQIRTAGGREMWVSVFLGDSAGIGFYRARGFEPVETVRAALSRVDDHIVSLRMRRVLD
ncbi:ribosomal protein S18 acetylase RimI-like enzyme [Catenuloplanes nepalensis]|uniref:Ribosomal protein S18 acetylase RimI-like enzyme n=1 Tax=Catenuloplanes nepalensis TaxID=587533 RepID=A0ABT9MPI1_9ACTN|nr:GNAT family N-acetyltransferase [Catenuloplanes nepalensis]MDP9793335.1 ribosomal protein S18 acetylase RimI-like enzyme [Catenuloplanes nepalensis]